jgi:ligand-binding SRPBCC domain-containing protein
MEHVLDTASEVPLPADVVFAFFSQAENLQRITPPELHFEIVTPLPLTIALGTLIEHRLRLFGVPLSWTSRISEWDPPRRFTDEQLRGPYAEWVHAHTFEPTPAGTLIRDRVRYRLPLSPLGDIAYPLVRRQLARIFAYRQRAVSEALLGSG